MSHRRRMHAFALMALAVGLFLLRLWQPEEQVRKHSVHLLDAIAHKNWTKFAASIGDDYHDQWGNDGAALMERTREVFRYLHGVRISAIAPDVQVQNGAGRWRAAIRIDGDDDNELMASVKS